MHSSGFFSAEVSHLSMTLLYVRSSSLEFNEELLRHLNRVRPTIKFTVEQEEDGTLPFLNMLFRSREHGRQPGCLCLQEAHAHGPISHHPTHMKRGVVRSLHNRARGIHNTQDNLQKEVDHLARVLKQNGYPANYIYNAFAPPTQETTDMSSPDEGHEGGEGSTGGDTLHGWDEWGHQACLQEVQHQSSL